LKRSRVLALAIQSVFVLAALSDTADAACLQKSKLKEFSECVAASVNYQMNEAPISLEKATKDAVNFCYSRIAR